MFGDKNSTASTLKSKWERGIRYNASRHEVYRRLRNPTCASGSPPEVQNTVISSSTKRTKVLQQI